MTKEVLLMIIASAVALLVFILYVSKRWEQIGNEETDEAEREARQSENTMVIPDTLERVIFKDALERTWDILENINTNDIVEFYYHSVVCQVGYARSDSDFRMLVKYFPKEQSIDIESLNYPMEKEGGLYNILYVWPSDKELLVSHMRKILNINDEEYIDFLYWKGSDISNLPVS